MGKVQFSLRIEESFLKLLRKVAIDNDESVSDVISSFIKKGMAFEVLEFGAKEGEMGDDEVLSNLYNTDYMLASVDEVIESGEYMVSNWYVD